MNTHRKYALILASVMAVILALPGGAWAGDRYDRGGHDSSYQKKGQQSRHYDNRHNDRSGKHGQYDNRHNEQYGKYGHYNNHNKYYYNNNYYGGGHYKGGNYYKGGRYYYPYNSGYNNYCYKNKQHHDNNDNDNDNDKLWLGLLGGGIVGYTLSNIYTDY